LGVVAIVLGIWFVDYEYWRFRMYHPLALALVGALIAIIGAITIVGSISS